MATPRTGAIVVSERGAARDLLLAFAASVKAGGLAVGGLVRRGTGDVAAVRCDLVVLDQFAALEAEGGGLADKARGAMSKDIPLLIAVDTRYLGAWMTFSGGRCALLEAKPEAVRAWWEALRAEALSHP